jgi:hypothetical protein
MDPPAVEQVDELRAQLRQFPLRKPLLRARPRHRRAARLELELRAAVRRQARGSAAQHVGVLGLERCKCRAIGAGQVQLRVCPAEGREVKHSAVPKHLQPVGEEARTARLRRAARATPRARSLPCHRLDSEELGVVRMDRP